MTTLFTKIVAGEIPCHRVAEDEHCLAFLDIRPLNPGHTLVIPKREVDYIFDVDDALLQHMILFAKRVARGIRQVAPCTKVGVIVAGLEVPHAHIHLVPIHAIADLNFARAKPMSTEELSAWAARIRAALGSA